MTTKRALKLGLIAVLLAGYAAAAQSDPWQKLNLSKTDIAGATVYYEKCFEPNLPFFEKTYRQFCRTKTKSSPRSIASLELRTRTSRPSDRCWMI